LVCRVSKYFFVVFPILALNEPTLMCACGWWSTCCCLFAEFFEGV
jgi:hypothetical protein